MRLMRVVEAVIIGVAIATAFEQEWYWLLTAGITYTYMRLGDKLMPMGQMQKTVTLNVTTFVDLWPYSVMDEIQKVMEQGEKDGKEDWEEQRAIFHIFRAREHLNKWLTSAEGTEPEDHLAHAFTRLMMAMAIERGYLDKKEDEDA